MRAHERQTPVEGMRAKAGRGMAFMLANTGFSKILVFTSFVILGRRLSQDDFGIYAMALGVQMFVQTFRDGGVRELLIQRSAEWDELVGSTFWLAFSINVIVGLLIGVVGEIVSHVYFARGQLSSPGELSRLLWVIAAALPLGTPATVLTARLKIDLRFKSLAWVATGSSIIRYGGQVTCAYLGFGALSFVLPVPALMLFESAATWALTRQQPWTRAPQAWRWPGMLATSIWLSLGQVCAGITNQGYLMVAGYYVARDELGIYLWAVQLLMQVETTIASNIVQVLFPVLAKFNDDPARQGQAAVRVARACSLITAPLTIGLAVTYPALERIIWQGKWAEAWGPMVVLAIFYPIRSTFVAVPGPVLQAQGRFRQWFMMWFANCVGLIIITCLAAAAGRSMMSLAWGVGAFLAVSCTISSVRVLSSVRVSVLSTLDSILTAPVLAVVAGIAAWWLDHACAGPWIEAHTTAVLTFKGRAIPTAAACRFLFSGTTFCVFYVILARLKAPGHLADMIAILPSRIRVLMRAALRLSAEPG